MLASSRDTKQVSRLRLHSSDRNASIRGGGSSPGDSNSSNPMSAPSVAPTITTVEGCSRWITSRSHSRSIATWSANDNEMRRRRPGSHPYSVGLSPRYGKHFKTGSNSLWSSPSPCRKNTSTSDDTWLSR